MTTFSSFRLSPMIALFFGSRGRSNRSARFLETCWDPGMASMRNLMSPELVYSSGDPSGPPSVHAVKIKLGGTKIRRLPGIRLREQLRLHGECEIVIQKLSEEGDTLGHIRIVGIVPGSIVQGIEKASFHAELFSLFSSFIGRGRKRWRLWKHAAEDIGRQGRAGGCGLLQGVVLFAATG